jgi:hypothetical protein
MNLDSILWILVGIIIGIGITNRISIYKQEKTFEQIDKEMFEELKIAKSLNESLLEDVNYWRNKFNTLRNIKNG